MERFIMFDDFETTIQVDELNFYNVYEWEN